MVCDTCGHKSDITPRFSSPFNDILDCLDDNGGAFTVRLDFDNNTVGSNTVQTLSFSSLLGFDAFSLTGISSQSGSVGAAETVALKDVLSIYTTNADAIDCVTNSF